MIFENQIASGWTINNFLIPEVDSIQNLTGLLDLALSLVSIDPLDFLSEFWLAFRKTGLKAAINLLRLCGFFLNQMNGCFQTELLVNPVGDDQFNLADLKDSEVHFN